jgi:chemotaxis methyl-accepting protein methylase
MAYFSIKTTEDYLVYLDGNQAESVMLLESLSNFYSEFFRNPLTFLMLEQIILPKIYNDKSAGRKGEVRIWSAGCAAGQEPYSIAILAKEIEEKCQDKADIRIFATDKSEKELQTARKGIYHERSLHNTRFGFVSKHFSNSGEFYSINSSIKDLVEFSVFDMLDEDAGSPPSSVYGDFDIVMCSNVLFYYKREIQKFILDRISDSLVKGGFLITGEAEVAIIKSFRHFKQYDAPSAVFIKT